MPLRRQNQRKPRNNAAIYFHSDGFDPHTNKLNGRRIAGESFLRGFIEHADIDALCGAVDSKAQSDGFIAFAKKYAFPDEIKTRLITNRGLVGNQTVLHVPGPDLSKQAWRRHQMGGAPYSITGVTHTIATKRTMQALFDLRTAPVEKWDAIICTSNAVKASVDYQLAEADRFLKGRFGRVPPRPQTPLIPLGINSADFAHDDAARKSWRERLQIAPDDLIVMTMSRLNSFGKFDPLPMFAALELAAAKTKHKIHFLAVGPYSDKVTTRVFEQGAARLAPSVQYHHIDGTVEPMAMGLWSAADIFTHPVDNIQETFGLAPVEAMAAGLPVVVSDWDGFKDTISRETGMRIRTLGPKAGSMSREALAYFLDNDTYAQYMAQASFQTAIDVRRLADAYATLCNDAALRKSMGAAGVRRARSIYDWSRIIPMYQECWADLDAMRIKSLGAKARLSARSNPTGPDPSRMFARYPTEAADFSNRKFKVQMSGDAKIAIDDMLSLREVPTLKRMSVLQKQLVTVLEVLQKDGFASYDMVQKATTQLAPQTLDRCLLWLLKYDFISVQLD